MAPTPLTTVAVARSSELRDVQELAAEVGLSPAERLQLRNNGLVRVPVARDGLMGLVIGVLAELPNVDWQPRTCATVFFTHSLELTELQLAEIDEMLRATLPGLTRAPLVVSGQPCSVIHLGIEMAVRNLHPGRTALVLGADAAQTHEDRFFFGSAMGDAAVGLVLGGTPVFGHVLAVKSSSHVLASEGASSPTADIERFRAQNPTAIRAVITDALTSAGLEWTDLAAIVPHTPYHQIWDSIAVLCRFPRERILDHALHDTGHLNSNDVVVHFAAAARSGRLQPGDVVALVSPGFGGTRGCTIVRYNPPRGANTPYA